MYRRELIQNLASLSLIPLIPLPKKEMFEHCEVITLNTDERYVTHNTKYNIVYAYLEYVKEKGDNCLAIPLANSRDDKAVFKQFKKCPDFKNNKYIYIVTYGEYTGYVMSYEKLRLQYIILESKPKI